MRRRGGFTLLELLIVIALVAVLTASMLTPLAGGRRSTALQSGQATLLNAITATRLKAMATGRAARLLINDDPAAGARYRRELMLAEETAEGWVARKTVMLADGVYVVPYRTRIPAGLWRDPIAWKTADGTDVLASSSLDAAPVVSPEGELCEVLHFSPAGTTTASGRIVLASGRLRAPSEAATVSPVELDDPESVRGVLLSAYGLARPVDGREGF